MPFEGYLRVSACNEVGFEAFIHYSIPYITILGENKNPSRIKCLLFCDTRRKRERKGERSGGEIIKVRER